MRSEPFMRIKNLEKLQKQTAGEGFESIKIVKNIADCSSALDWEIADSYNLASILSYCSYEC